MTPISIFFRRGALALSLLLLPHASALGQDNAKTDAIVIYNAQHKSLTEAWAAAFTKETGIPATIRHGSDTEFGNQLIQEGAASPADVFLTENSPAMAMVEAAGLFEPIAADVLTQVPEQYRPPSGRWIGMAARSTVFVYNKTKLTPEQLPKSIMDLASPDWKGRWAASPAGADFQAIVSAMLELKGEAATAEWLKAMKTNATPYKGNGTAMRAVNAGQADGAVIYHYYYFGDQARTGENSANIGLHFFRHQDPGAFLSVSGAGVLASSKNRDKAMAFVKWLTGKGGQDILREKSFEYAVGNGAPSNSKLTPIADLDAPKVNAAKLDSRKVIQLMTAAGIL